MNARSDLRTLEATHGFPQRVHHTKRQLLSFLIECKEQGAKLCGYGAPGKGNTLLNYCGIGTDFLDFTVDRNPYKHGRYTPGMHIPIYPVSAIDEARPDYLLILPWNLKNEIVAQMRHVGDWGCKFVVPIPSVEVIDPRELSVMKVVLFCGGLGTRIREYSENIPKPMVPIGHQPILWHVMQYYSQYGHQDFILCLGYKANVIKDYFLNYKQTANSDCIISDFGKKVEILGERPPDWRITLVDTGTWRNIGERLVAVRHLVEDEEIFLANYSDGLTDAPLADMIDRFKKSGKIGCFIAIHPPISFHLAEFDEQGAVQRLRSSQKSEIWINGGYFIFRNEIFDYIREGEELVLEPFNRLIEGGQLMAYKYEGFWRAMDTLRDRQVLEEMVERGEMPWRVLPQVRASACVMKALQLAAPGDRLSVLCLGAHSDDIEIGAGATLLSMLERGIRLEVHWCVLSGAGEREREAKASAADFLVRGGERADRGDVLSGRLFPGARRCN